MSFLGGVLMIVTGLVLMAAGLFLFYAWLPFLYALVGFDIGALLGKWMTGDVGVLAITLGVIGALVLGLSSYYLEPFRRILMGISSGVLIGFALANLFGFDGRMGAVSGMLLAILFGVVGASVVPRYFDLFVVVATAIGGAGLVMSGAHSIMPGVAIFDATSGGSISYLLSLALAVIGIVWQFSNVEKWLKAHVMPAQRTD